MSAPEAFQVRPLDEADLDFALGSAGGICAHPDADSRTDVGADYKLGSAVIELKALDEEGLFKPSRQKKVATLFQQYEPGRPVIVLDRQRLNPSDRTRFDRIMEGPIKTAVSKANRQLKQSRLEHGDATCSVLMVINNGYTTLDHEALKDLVAHRVRQDTHEIDAVVVAGAYYHSDGFEGFFLWPIDCISINLERPFAHFEQLRQGWHALAERFMNLMVTGGLRPEPFKGPVADTQFDVNGTTYIRPAPIMGADSKFYIYGRPRKDSSGVSVCPPVGLTFPALSKGDWERLQKLVSRPADLLGSYEAWKQEEIRGLGASEPLCPFVTVPVTVDAWKEWSAGRVGAKESIFQFANDLFSERVRELVYRAREIQPRKIVPSHYVLAITDEIGQDRANDVSRIVIVRERPNGEAIGREIVTNARVFHEHALALASAYAVKERLDSVMWAKNLKYAWI